MTSLPSYFDEKEMVEELRKLGYQVLKVEYPSVETVDTVKKLLTFFYSQVKMRNPDRIFPFSVDYSEDTKYLSTFVQSQERTAGLGRKAAVKQCAFIVKAALENEHLLRLEFPINNPKIFTSRPFVDRICMIINREESRIEEEKTIKFVERMNEIYDREYARRDFEIAARERKEILEKLNERKK